MINSQLKYLLFFLPFLFGCVPDQLEPGTGQSVLPQGDRFYDATVSYDLEIITRRDLIKEGQENLTFIDQIAGEELASRQTINAGIHADGSVDLVIVEQSPKIDVTGGLRGGNLPNLSPSIFKTEIANGTIRMYDKTETLLYEHPIEKNYEAGAGINRLIGNYDWKNYANQPGAVIEVLTDDTYLIRKPVPEGEVANLLQKSVGWYTEEVIVEDLNLLLGCSLHEADGSVISRTVFKYDYSEDQDRWLPEMSYYEEVAVNEATGSQYMLQTTSYYEGFAITFN